MLNRNPYRFLLFSGLLLLSVVLSCRDTKSTERILKRLNLEYSIDSEGDYRVELELADGRQTVVGVSAHTALLDGDVRVREMWSVAARLPGTLPEELADNLLRDTWSSRKIGAWALAGTTSDGKQVLVHVTRLPEGSSKKVFYAALLDTAISALDLGEALTHLEGE